MPVGKTKDAGRQIGVSRTVPLPPEDVWARIEDNGVAGPGGRRRAQRPPLDRIRVGLDGTIVRVALREAKTGTTVTSFHQERLSGAEERERQRAHWSSVIDRLFPERR